MLSSVDLLGTSVHTVQVIGIVTKCRELVNLIFRQCKDVNDHIFKTFVRMPILKEELPSSLKTLKHVDIAGSDCSIHTILILVQEWLFPKMTWINVESIQISIKRAAFLRTDRPSLVQFQDPFPILPGLPKLGNEGSLEAEIYSTFHISLITLQCLSINYTSKNSFYKSHQLTDRVCYLPCTKSPDYNYDIRTFGLLYSYTFVIFLKLLFAF